MRMVNTHDLIGGFALKNARKKLKGGDVKERICVVNRFYSISAKINNNYLNLLFFCYRSPRGGRGLKFL